MASGVVVCAIGVKKITAMNAMKWNIADHAEKNIRLFARVVVGRPDARAVTKSPATTAFIRMSAAAEKDATIV